MPGFLLPLLAFLCAVPVGMGLGGGGLFTLSLTLLGTPQLTAQGLNLFCFLAAGGGAAARRLPALRDGGWLPSLLLLCAGALAGAFPGAWLAGKLPPALLRRLLGGFLLLTGLYGLLPGKKRKKAPFLPKALDKTPPPW